MAKKKTLGEVNQVWLYTVFDHPHTLHAVALKLLLSTSLKLMDSAELTGASKA